MQTAQIQARQIAGSRQDQFHAPAQPLLTQVGSSRRCRGIGLHRASGLFHGFGQQARHRGLIAGCGIQLVQHTLRIASRNTGAGLILKGRFTLQILHFRHALFHLLARLPLLAIGLAHFLHPIRPVHVHGLGRPDLRQGKQLVLPSRVFVCRVLRPSLQAHPHGQ